MGSPADRTVESAQLVFERFESQDLVRRNRLVSKMLQDRSTLRLLSAPHGYGKSALAYEYAARLFSPSSVRWIDAEDPSFIKDLDLGRFPQSALIEGAFPNLLVIDGLPYLDEERAQALTGHLGELLALGVEIVATTTPAHDCLRSLVPDRLLLSAQDLQVTEREIRSCAVGSAELSKAVEHWVRAGELFAGTLPAVYWGTGNYEQQECVCALFAESLPREVIKAAFAMIMLKTGNLDLLEHMDLRLSVELQNMLILDYPLLGIDPIQRAFKVGDIDMGALLKALRQAEVDDLLLTGIYPLHMKAMDLLLARGEGQRAAEIMDVFCTGEQAADWLEQSGWALLNACNLPLLERVFERCSEAALDSRAGINAIKAWSSGLLGDEWEAFHYARKAFRLAQNGHAEKGQSNPVQMMAYLALLVFGGANGVAYAKEQFCGECIMAPNDLLCAVVDLCTDVELARAFSLHPDERTHLLEGERKPPAPEAASALVSLATGYAEAFGTAPAYRLALHILQFVDNEAVRAALRQAGAETVVNMRRTGVSTVIDALLVSDLWCNGLFGASTTTADVRDSRLLNGASQVFNMLNSLAVDLSPIPILWEIGARTPTASGEDGGLLKRPSKIKTQQRLPNVSVRLFGGVEIMVGDRLIPETAWRHKALVMFSLLVLAEGREVARDMLLGQIWPGVDRSHALDSYYTAWSNAQRLLGQQGYLERMGEYCRINTRFVNSDVAEFDQLSRRILIGRDSSAVLLDIYARMESIYCGGLMPGERKNETIAFQREHYRNAFTDAMVAASAKSLETHDSQVALWFARKALENDARREDVYQVLMKAQVTAGQRCSAMRTYFTCRDFLREELGIDPSSQIQRMYQSLIGADPSLSKLDPALSRK